MPDVIVVVEPATPEILVVPEFAPGPSTGGGGSTVIVKDEGTTLATPATGLNFVGDGVVASGTGVTKTVTIPGDAAAIADEADDRITGDELALQKSANLGDVDSAATSRVNLGLGTSATNNKVAAGFAGVLDAADASTANSRSPNGAAGGVLAGTYPSPTFAADMATQAELDAEAVLARAEEALKIPLTQKSAANGVAALDSGGKVPANQLPNSIMEYQGVWNATTNSPVLANGTGNTGDVYRVGVAGTQNLGSGAITFDVGDYAVYNSSGIWEKSDTTDSVPTVFGRIGNVLAQGGDYAAFYDTLGAAANAQAASQPLDSDLTAIAALATSSFGRNLLALFDAAAGRTALGLGTAATSASGDFQPIDSDLTAIAALATTVFGRGILTVANSDDARALLELGSIATSDASDFLSALNNLGDLTDPSQAFLNLGLGSAALEDTSSFDPSGSADAAQAASQPLDSDLTAIAALATTAFGRSFLALADAAAGRTLLALGTAALTNTGTGGANVPTITQADARYQPLDADLTALAALATTAFGRSFLDRADATAGRTLLGLGTAAVSAAGDFATTLTPTAVKTANYAAAAGDFVPVDTTAGTITITLPNAPADKTRIGIKQIIRGGTNTVNYTCAGTDVINRAGGATTGTLTLLAESKLLQYQAAGGIWTVQAGDIPLSQLDSRFIPATLIDANTVVYGTVDDTPAALAMGASTILARLAAGNIVAATPTQLKTLLAIVSTDLSDFTEAAQDVIGALLVDSSTIDYTYNDAGNAQSIAIVAASITASLLAAGAVTPPKLAASVALADGANIATDASLGSVFKVTIAGNRTIDNPTNPTAGQKIVYRIKQDGTGSRTITWGSKFRWGTDVTVPTLTTTAAKIDYIGFIYNADDDKWDGVAVAKGY